MAIPALLPLPLPPTQATPENEWPDKADAFVTAQYGFSQQLNDEFIPGVNQMAGDVEQAKVSASDSATAAGQSAGQALAARNQTEGFRGDAEGFKNAAVAAAQSAGEDATVAGQAATASEQAATDAETARQAAVVARNEAEQFAQEAGQAAAGDLIDDSAPRLDRAYSSQKVVDLLASLDTAVHDLGTLPANGIAVVIEANVGEFRAFTITSSTVGLLTLNFTNLPAPTDRVVTWYVELVRTTTAAKTLSFQIDGAAVTPQWSAGAAPVLGSTANSRDVIQFYKWPGRSSVYAMLMDAGAV